MPSDIPPPIRIEKQQSPDDLSLPFILADTPRMFLNFLANYSGLDERYRHAISEWVHQHNAILGEYLLETYGPKGAALADQIARTMYEQFLHDIQERREDAENELFAWLEDEMDNFDGTDSD